MTPLQSSEFSLCNCPRQQCVCISVHGSALKVFNVPSSSAAGHTPHGAPTGLKLSHPTLQKSTMQGEWNRRQSGLSASSVWFSEDSDTATTSKAKGLRTICITVLMEKTQTARRWKVPQGSVHGSRVPHRKRMIRTPPRTVPL